jgi:hypothetical protein
LGFQVIEIIGPEVIAAANEGELLIHCRVNPTGQLQFNLKGRQQERLTGLERDLGGLVPPPQSVNVLDLF